MVTEGWNHNIHYHPVVLRAVPDGSVRVLDVGCGEGELARALSGQVGEVVGIDLDAPTVERARRDAAADNVEYVVGDFLTYDFMPGSFDAVVSVVALHHMDMAAALARMRELVRPGGRIAVVGVARSRYPADLGFDLAGAIATRLHKLTKTFRETSAPKVWPPPLSFSETRRLATPILPGVRYRRHILWRYSLLWTNPVG